MKGIEKDLRDMSIRALVKAFSEIGSLRCDFAVEKVGGGKSDTYGLDAIPEETIKVEGICLPDVPRHLGREFSPS